MSKLTFIALIFAASCSLANLAMHIDNAKLAKKVLKQTKEEVYKPKNAVFIESSIAANLSPADREIYFEELLPALGLTCIGERPLHGQRHNIFMRPNGLAIPAKYNQAKNEYTYLWDSSTRANNFINSNSTEDEPSINVPEGCTTVFGIHHNIKPVETIIGNQALKQQSIFNRRGKWFAAGFAILGVHFLYSSAGYPGLTTVSEKIFSLFRK